MVLLQYDFGFSTGVNLALKVKSGDAESPSVLLSLTDERFPLHQLMESHKTRNFYMWWFFFQEHLPFLIIRLSGLSEEKNLARQSQMKQMSRHHLGFCKTHLLLQRNRTLAFALKSKSNKPFYPT